MSFIGPRGSGVPFDIRTKYIVRNLPAVGNYIEICKFTGNDLPLTLEISAVALNIAKMYAVAVGDTDPPDTWYRLLPFTGSDPSDTEDFDLYIFQDSTANETILRFQRKIGTLTGNANLVVRYGLGTTFTALTGTGTMSALTNFWPSTSLSQLGKKVVICEDDFADSFSEDVKLVVVGDATPFPSDWLNTQMQIHGKSTPFEKLSIGIETGTGDGIIQSGVQGSAFTALHLQPQGGNTAFGAGTKTITSHAKVIISSGGTAAHLRFIDTRTSGTEEDGQLWYQGGELYFVVGSTKYKLDKTAV